MSVAAGQQKITSFLERLLLAVSVAAYVHVVLLYLLVQFLASHATFLV